MRPFNTYSDGLPPYQVGYKYEDDHSEYTLLTVTELGDDYYHLTWCVIAKSDH